jgi:hypothetical protein
MIHTIKTAWNSFQVNDAISLNTVQRCMPRFFATAHGKRETYGIYKGFLIVRHTVKFANDPPVRRTVIYMIVADEGEKIEGPNPKIDALHVTNSAGSIRQAEKIIDRILQTGTTCKPE